MNILVIESDQASQLLLKAMLMDYQLTIVDSGEAAIEAVRKKPDMIILDVVLSGIDGYETCQKIRNMDGMSSTPIIFLSSCKDLKDRLQAYEAGGNDYISKPFDVQELKSKINNLNKYLQQQFITEQRLQDSHGLLMNVQTSSAKLQSISKFIQLTIFCPDIETLANKFSQTATEIGLEFCLRIDSQSGNNTYTNRATITSLEKEILELSSSVDRIFSFGRERTIFRWGHAVLLTHKIGELIDILAIFMDALEAGIKTVDTKVILFEQIEKLQQKNDNVRKNVSNLFSIMNDDIQNSLISLGMVSALDLDDEERLTELLNTYNQKIDNELQVLGENNQHIHSLVNELRQPPIELQAIMDDDTEDSEDILF